MHKYLLSIDLRSRRFKGVCVLLGMLGVSLLLSQCVRLKHSNEMIHCLALNVYHEGRGEPLDGRVAIATVTMNRVASEKFPNNVCQVVFERRYHQVNGFYVGQFSWTQDRISNTPEEEDAWIDAINLSRNVYENGLINKEVKDALFYHATYVLPVWAKSMNKKVTIGQHIFY